MSENGGSLTSTGDMSQAVSDGSYGAEPSSGAGWSDAVHPIVDPSGVVAALNPAAAHLFPAAAAGARLSQVAPAWLVAAHRRLAAVRPAREPGRAPERVSGRVAERTVEAHPNPLSSGSVMWWLVDDTDRRHAAVALAAERDRLAILVETFDALSASLNVDRSTEVTARLAARHLADAAVVIAWTADGALTVTSGRRDGATARCTMGADGADVLRVPGVQEALQGYPPPPSRRVDPSQVPPWLVPDLAGDIGSAAVIPLPGHGMPAGALLTTPAHRRGGIDRRGGDAARSVRGARGSRPGGGANVRGASEDHHGVAQDLLPPQLPDVDGVEFAGGYRASNDAERVSGDFYDVHLGSDTDNEPFVVLGDVCGKGLDAAILTGKIRNTLHALLPVATDHHRLLDLLNRTLVNSHHNQFATLVLGTVSRSGPRVRLRLTCAGHPAPLVVHVDGRVEEADTHGSLIGLLPTVHATTAMVELLPGETCLLYTDGLTEARGGPMGGDMFGEQRLRSALAECAGLTADAIVERIQVLVSDCHRSRARSRGRRRRRRIDPRRRHRAGPDARAAADRQDTGWQARQDLDAHLSNASL